MKHTFDELHRIAAELRMDVMEMGPRSGNVMHVGPAYSCTDILTVLYYEFMNIRPEDPQWEDRDRFVLSKGHACPIQYALLARLGYFPREELWNAKNLDSILQGHPSMRKTPGLDSSSGSLGNGLAIGLGMALGLKEQKKKASVYVVMGDGEFQEGLSMEAMLAAPTKGADNLVAIVDYNHHQSSGSVENIMPLHSLAEKWKSFGWRVFEIDGHNMEEIYSRLSMAKNYEGRPTCIIAHTVKGKGVGFIEHNNAWHAKMPTAEEYRIAMEELSAECRRYGGDPDATERWTPDQIKPFSFPKFPYPMDSGTGSVIGPTLVELSKTDDKIAVVSSDSIQTMALQEMERLYPERTYNVGIAEQDAMGIGAGLASTGLKTVVAGYAPFVTMRAVEQFRTFVAYTKQNVLVTGALGGFSSSNAGPTHQGIEDYGIVRMFPNTTITVPCDAVSAKAAMKAQLSHGGPGYIRLGAGPGRKVYEEGEFSFELGKANCIKDGSDITIITAGGVITNVLDAIEPLENEGISVRVLNMISLKPIDKEAILCAAAETGAIVTVEEHQITNGLGTAVAEILVENTPVPMKRVGIQDTFGCTGNYKGMLDLYHMGVSDIIAAVKETLARKK